MFHECLIFCLPINSPAKSEVVADSALCGIALGLHKCSREQAPVHRVIQVTFVYKL